MPAGGGLTASWTNPDGQFAPLAKAHYKLCPVGLGAGPCQAERTATGTNISSITGLRLPGPGTWGLTVWLEDAAGNVGTANIAPPSSARPMPRPASRSPRPSSIAIAGWPSAAGRATS